VNETIQTLSETLPSSTILVSFCEVDEVTYGFYSGCAFIFDTTTESITVLSTNSNIDGYFCCVIDNNIYMGKTSSIKIFLLSLGIALPYDALLMHSTLDKNIFNLINTDNAQVEIGVIAVYKGNADGIGEQVKASLHNGTSWVTI
jgi:hypothetical protein